LKSLLITMNNLKLFVVSIWCHKYP
jgi:hypothetical protein